MGVLIALAIGLFVLWQVGQNCSIVNWCRISEIFFNAAITVGVGVLAAFLVDRLYRRRRFQKQEDVLLELAKLRTRGVELRNMRPPSYLSRHAAEVWLRIWVEGMENWKQALYDTAEKFSSVEAERLKTLDTMTPISFQGFSVSSFQQFTLLYVSETLRRLDKMLEQRFRPTQSP